jgi:hypothetical protein
MRSGLHAVIERFRVAQVRLHGFTEPASHAVSRSNFERAARIAV